MNTEELWLDLRGQAERFIQAELAITDFLNEMILQRSDFVDALIYLISPIFEKETLARSFLDNPQLREAGRKVIHHAARDLEATRERDPACENVLQAFLNFKGFKALTAYRFAHFFWRRDQKMMAWVIQSRISDLWGVDVHPAARIGSAIMMDHASGIVIGETAVIEDDVSILHGVSLGGKGMKQGDRHPKVRRGVFIGAGAKILGNIEVGAGAVVAAGSVVLSDVPANTTVAGVPARVIHKNSH